jgi:hypothetical protein
MSLVTAVAALETTAAYRALVPSIGVSLGVGQRVARLGDEAVPALRNLISRHYETDVALGTLGFVSFWADSTHSPLSATSRSQILQAFLSAYADTSSEAQLGLLMGLRSAADPTLLPLARALEAKARAGHDDFIAIRLGPVITSLEARRRQLSLADLLRIVVRNVHSICEGSSHGQRHGFCQSTENQIGTITRHVESGNTSAAKAGLGNVLKAAGHARASGSITPAEQLLIVGWTTEVLSRLP